jgi:hypothetical protein
MRLILVLTFLFIITTAATTDFFARLSDAAISLTLLKVKCDPAYISIPYPNDDV